MRNYNSYVLWPYALCCAGGVGIHPQITRRIWLILLCKAYQNGFIWWDSNKRKSFENNTHLRRGTVFEGICGCGLRTISSMIWIYFIDLHIYIKCRHEPQPHKAIWQLFLSCHQGCESFRAMTNSIISTNHYKHSGTRRPLTFVFILICDHFWERVLIASLFELVNVWIRAVPRHVKKISDLSNKKFWNFWIPEMYLLNSVKFVFWRFFPKELWRKIPN